MSTRRAVFQLKADSSAGFTRIVEGHILPSLHAQSGCRHEDICIDGRPTFAERAARLRMGGRPRRSGRRVRSGDEKGVRHEW